MFTVKRRVFGKATDGRTILLYAAGQEVSDDEARRAGLLAGEPAVEQPVRGLAIESDERRSDEAAPAKPLERMKLGELRALCEAEGIDPGAANLRAEFIEAIEAARTARDFEAGPRNED